MLMIYDYLIIGGGVASDAAVHGIRERDPEGSIAVLCGEDYPPYCRPPLSKDLWKGKSIDTIWRHTKDGPASIFRGCYASGGDATKKVITDRKGNLYRYKKLLLATGGVPRRIPVDIPGIIYFRTLDDYHQVRILASTKHHFIIIGGGFIGSELAASLVSYGCRVTMIFPGHGIGSHIYPLEISEYLTFYLQENGVNILSGQRPQELQKEDSRFRLVTDRGNTVTADAVIAGIGIDPNVSLAKSLGLMVDNGIVVDERLRTNQPDIFAAGDVANFYCPSLDKRRRVEHEDNAAVMGAIAGRNMAGGEEPYDYLPYFYSDILDVGFEAVGELRSDMEVVQDWTTPFKRGVTYYMECGRVRGVLLWGIWGKLDSARLLISDKGPIDSKDLLESRSILK